MQIISPLTSSPVEQLHFQGLDFYLKRDDLLHSEFSGNKARKFHYFLQQNFPGINKIISYGSPQANSLYSLSALGKLKNWQVDFYVDHIPATLRANPCGNYLAALNNSANIIALNDLNITAHPAEYIQQQILPNEKNALFVPEGGRCQEAENGVKILAGEIKQWAEENNIDKLKIVLPAGTGTTALFLQKNLPFEVLTCACVGGEQYLQKQFYELSDNPEHHPTIMSNQKKYHFGKLYAEFYAIWQDLEKETNIEFELLYDPLAWINLLALKQEEKLDGYKVLYIHQGGLLGNESMLQRYQRKNRLKCT